MVENRAIQVNQNGEDPTRCRYKTGRCINARVLKPNGTLLLLCEFHRNQQNRTKKRSDMKYRQDRAKKRLVGRHQSPDDATPAPLSSTSIQMARTTCVGAAERGGASNGAASPSLVNSKRNTSSNIDSAFHPTKRLKPYKREDSKSLAAQMPQSIGLEHLAIIARSNSSSTTIEPNNQIRRAFEPLHAQEIRRRHDPVDTSAPKTTDSMALSDYPVRTVHSSANDHRTCDLDETMPCSFFLVQSCSLALDQRWPPDDVQLLEYFIL